MWVENIFDKEMQKSKHRTTAFLVYSKECTVIV